MIDVPLSLWLHARPDTGLINVMLFITHWHSTIGILSMSAVLGLLLHRSGRLWWLLALAVSVPGGLLLNVGVKHLVQRARPHFDEPLLSLSTYSFPSGHTAGATLFYGFLTIFLLTHVRSAPWRRAIVAGAALMVLLVGFSRMYLGAHYFTDVAGAIVEGVLWLAFCLAAVRVLRRRCIGRA